MQTSLVPLASPAHCCAELVTLNGKSPGIRRSLQDPVTVIGLSKGCDIRLAGERAKPVHCIITLGSEGPYLRSFGSEDTFVNEIPLKSRLLRDGDKLVIGSCQFEVCYRPAAVSPNVRIVESVSVDQRQQLLVGLQAQLREARVKYRKKRDEQRAEIAREILGLAQSRNEIEVQQVEVTTQRQRLSSLRDRFIKRWKKHWSTERAKLSHEIKELSRERASFHQECATFEFQKARFETYRVQEREKIQKSSEKLSEEKANWQSEHVRREAQLEKQRQELESWASQLAVEEQKLGATRLQVEQRCARLRVEAEGLESRVLNTRAVLVHLEQQGEILSAHFQEKKAARSELKEAPIAQTAEQNLASIVPIVEELNDQRLTLVEQLHKLVTAREQWRHEQTTLASELATLAEKLSQQEADVQQRQQAILHEQERQREKSDQLKRLREELEGRQSRHAIREMTSRAERHRAEVEMASKIEWVDRRERSVTELYRRWSDRRRKELTILREEHARCLELRQRWTATLLAEEQKQADKMNHQRELAEQTLILEHAKQELLDTVEDPLLAKRKLDRVERRVRSALAKMEQTLIDHREKLSTERKQLETLFCATLERIEELHARERSVSDQLAEWESQQTLLRQRVEGHVRQEAVWRAQREVYQQELRRLQAEIDRLTEYLLQNREEFIPLARAA